MLRDEGYATFCAGKWHLAPMEDCSAAGPFDQWPLGRGFDRFYGFLDGETDQFHPQLVCDNHPIDPPGDARGRLPPQRGPRRPAAADDRRQQGRAARPAVLRLPRRSAPPTRRTRRRPTYLAKYRGAFDDGLGRRPPALVSSASSTPASSRPAPSWRRATRASRRGTRCRSNQQRLACRLQEAFAAFLDHTDDQIGRLVDGLRAMGELDNTVLVVLADNGASQEGGPFGVMHEMKFFNGILETPDQAIARIDDIGGPHSHTNYPWGWAQCGNAPFKWYKQNTHEGGVHVPMIVHWPDGIDGRQRGIAAAPVRERRRHRADHLRAARRRRRPTSFRGVEQLPVTGHSFAVGARRRRRRRPPTRCSTSRWPAAGPSSPATWKAVCKHVQGADFDTEPWELYDLAVDASECHDLAAAQPGSAGRADRAVVAGGRAPRRAAARRPRHRAVRRPLPRALAAPAEPPLRVPPADVADPRRRPRRRSAGAASTSRPRSPGRPGDEGVLWATGTENSGISVFVQDDRLVVDYNAFDDHTIVESTVAVPVGDVELTVRFRRGERMHGIDRAGRRRRRRPATPTCRCSCG